MLMGLPTGYGKTTRPLRQYLDTVVQYRIRSALVKQTPKNTDLETIVADIQRRAKISKHVGKEATRLWSAIVIQRAWEIGLENWTFPKKLSFLVMEKPCFTTPRACIVPEL